MGIPSYFNFILKNHYNIINKKYHIRSDYFFVDANSLIYESINEFNNEIPADDLIYDKIYENICKLIDSIDPKYKTYLCFDGIPPVAKIIQQQQRRYKSSLINKVLDKTITWNRNKITPGSEFMNNLDNFLEKKFSKNKKIILSGSTINMEGEHKICNIINNNLNFKNYNLIIYGLDADLFMLGLLLHKNGNNIYLYKETKHFDYISKIDSNELYYFNIQTFSDHLALKLNNEKIQAIADYCLLAFLCGNDFLPHLYSINIRNNGISYIIDKYIELDGKLNPLINIVNGNINWKNFRKYLMLLIEEEKDKLLENLEWKINLKSKIYPLNNFDKLDMLPCVDNEKERYLYKNIDDFDNFVYSDCDVKEMSKKYIEMIEWTWYYYNNNDVKDNSKFYNYCKSPLLKDIITYIPVINSEIMINKTSIYNNINMNTLLFYVIPYDELDKIVSIKIYKKLSNIIYEKFPLLKETNYDINYFLCKYFWEGHLKIEYIDIFKLNNLIIDNI